MQHKIFDDFSQNCATHGTKTHLDYIRDGVKRYLADNDLTPGEFAQKAGISPHTMHSLLYKDITDCKLSTVIAIAATIGIGVDELANTGAMPDASLESVQIARSLPQPTIELIRRYIRWQKHMHDIYQNHPAKFVDVMNLDYVNDHLKTTEYIEKVDISEMSNDIKSRVFRGMRIPCNEYIQFYRENDILLLSDDRKPRNRERAVIQYYGRVFIVYKDTQDGIWGYRGLRNPMMFITENEIEYYFGYVMAVKHN